MNLQIELVSTLICCLLVLCGCIKSADSGDIRPLSQDTGETEKVSNVPSDDCPQWQIVKSKLSEAENRELEEYKVIIPREAPDDFRGYLLSADLVEDCEKRIKIGQVIRAIINGNETDADRKFAQQHSEEIVSVTLKIWDSCGFSVDGTRHEKYRLVNYEHFREKDNVLLLSNLLRTKKLNGDLVYAYLKRPIPSLSPLLGELLEEAENSGSLTDEICLAIMIEQTQRNRAMLPKLTALANKNELSEQTRKGILSIREKFRKKTAIKWKDIETLQLELSDFEENRDGTSPLCSDGVVSGDHSNK